MSPITSSFAAIPASDQHPPAQALLGALRARRAAILHAWSAMSGDEPARASTAEGRIDAMPDVVAELLAVGFDERAGLTEQWRLAVAAAAHGTARRARGADEGRVCEDVCILRELLANALRDCTGDEALRVRSMLRIDAALATATTAALRGFHRAELRQQELWPDALIELARDAALRQATAPVASLDPHPAAALDREVAIPVARYSADGRFLFDERPTAAASRGEPAWRALRRPARIV